VRQVGYLQGLYRDARSTEHKMLPYNLPVIAHVGQCTALRTKRPQSVYLCMK